MRGFTAEECKLIRISAKETPTTIANTTTSICGGGSRLALIAVTAVIQDDSKRLTHFVSLYGLNSKRRLNTRQTVGCGIPSSLLALRVDLRGLRSKLSSIRLNFSSDTRGRPELLPLHRQLICSNW